MDEQLVNEINDYLQGIFEDRSIIIEMSDSPIKSQGAMCVADAIHSCDAVREIKLANCEIRDRGAIAIFQKLANSRSVEVIDLSGNYLTERCFDAIETCLIANDRIKRVNLTGVGVTSKFAWGKFKRFGDIVVH